MSLDHITELLEAACNGMLDRPEHELHGAANSIAGVLEWLHAWRKSGGEES
jgi:hypothetical protein